MSFCGLRSLTKALRMEGKSIANWGAVCFPGTSENGGQAGVPVSPLEHLRMEGKPGCHVSRLRSEHGS